MTTLTATKVAGIQWIDGNKLVHFQSDRGYGVRNAAGEFLSFNGTFPSVWPRKSVAAEIAETLIDCGTLTWVPVRVR